MSKHRFIKELDPTVRGQRICLIEVNGDYYVVSSIPAAPDHGGPETLAFRSDENGEVERWADVAGGPGMSREETIAWLERGDPPQDVTVEMAIGALFGVLNPPGPDYYEGGDAA